MYRPAWSEADARSRSSRRTRPGASLATAIAMAIVGSLFPVHAYASGSLELIPHVPTLVALLIAFVILIFPLNSMIFKPLFGVLDERASRIEGARRRAEKLEEEAAEVTSRYREAVRSAREEAEIARQAQLAEARSEQGSITADAKAEAEAEVKRARSEIAGSIDAARVSLEGSAEGLARSAAERILGRSLS